jgi:hypothetical protein
METIAVRRESVPASATTDTKNLVLVVRRRAKHHWRDFQSIRDTIAEIAPHVRTFVIRDRWYHAIRPTFWRQPTMVFSPSRTSHFRPLRGRVFQGHLMRKSEEYRALESQGIPVPRWALVTADHAPDLSEFGTYVVSKPDVGGRGADVKIKRKTRVRWKAPSHDRAKHCQDLLVQDFVYTGPWAASYRVTTLFGQALFSWRVEADRSRRPLRGPEEFAGGADGGGISIASSGRGCTFTFNDDQEIIELGERAHAAFPNIPLLGVDIVREVPSGRLYVLEVNACGQVWHFSSNTGLGIQRDSGLDFASQFGGLKKAAKILADATRRFAA